MEAIGKTIRAGVFGRLRSIGIVAAVLIGFAMSGCGDSGGSDEAAGGSGAQLTTAEVDGVGTVLVDADGMTLYTNEAESDGRVRCVGACVDFWPPAVGDVPSEVEGVDGTFADVERPDGTRQLTLDGQPLYTFAEDSRGTADGDGFEDEFRGDHFVWHAVTASAEEPSSDDDGGGGIYGY